MCRTTTTSTSSNNASEHHHADLFRRTSGSGFGSAITPAFHVISPSAFESSSTTDTKLQASNKALLRTLKYSGVEFVRFLTVDHVNNLRAKIVPLKRLLEGRKKKNNNNNIINLDTIVSMAECLYGGVPSHADVLVEGTTVDARRVLTLQPDLSTLRILPYARKTAVVMANLYDPKTKGPNQLLSPLCARGILMRVLETAKQEHGIAFSVGAEIEFCLVHQDGNKPVDASNFASTTLLNDHEDLLSEIYNQLEEGQDIEVELIHSESAHGQVEVVLAYQDDPVKLADQVVLARETIRSVAKKYSMKALFLPKVNATQAGNGLHLHFSFRNVMKEKHDGASAFANNNNNWTNRKTAGTMMSPLGESFLEGLLERLPALMAFTTPSNNSFRRVGKGCWTGHSVSWNYDDKESPLRVVCGSTDDDDDDDGASTTHVELKLSDATANIYLELAAILSTGLDGIARKLQLRPCSDEVDASRTSEAAAPLPKSLGESLNHLKEPQNESFFRRVLGEDVITNYLAVKTAEANAANSITLEEEVERALQRA